jgi:uncharacterized membrane protein
MELKEEIMKKNSSIDIKKMTIIGVLGAISIVLGLTPLGFIPIGPTRATIMHIPVIIGAIMEGPIVGGFIGLIFGLSSMFQAVTNPTPISFVFLNPLVSILPRVLIGIVTYYVYSGFKKIGRKKTIIFLNIILASIGAYLLYAIYSNIIEGLVVSTIIIDIIFILILSSFIYFINTRLKDSQLDIIISSIMGSLTNTMGVLSTIYIFHGKAFVDKLGLDPSLSKNIIFGLALTNGIPEAIIGIIITISVVTALRRIR